MFYTLAKAARVFSPAAGSAIEIEHLQKALQDGRIPVLSRSQEPGGRGLGWNGDVIGKVGREVGFLKPLPQAKVISVFVTKGGVLKTSLTLNLARMAALHGIRTLVIGLDMQCDITTALGYQPDSENDESLAEAISKMDQTSGLYEYYLGEAGLEDVIVKTDLALLDLLPETPELVGLDQQLLARARREYWLRDKVIAPLKQKYDLILLDCSPNWNQLITNALVASDLLLSPLECKINNYRNLKMFKNFVDQFKLDLELPLKHCFVPTRLSFSRKLSREIYEWYLGNVDGCFKQAICESVQGEESSAMHLSVAEYAPSSKAAEEMKSVLTQLWSELELDKTSLSNQVSRAKGLAAWL